MSTREILTLQFGHYTNYVGAHFWNIQELSFDYTGLTKTECNHDVLFREGRTSTGEVTYTPRLLVADLKGSLKSFKQAGGLPDEAQDIPQPWQNVEVIKEPECSKNQYLNDLDKNIQKPLSKEYNLEEDVVTWTDYLYSRFHPRTVNIVKDYQHNNETESFDVYTTGQNTWKSEFGDTFSDNIRKYVEECDSMQGFHVNFDCTDGFAGLALSCIEHLSDEYSKSILAHPIIPSYFSDNSPKTQEERDTSNLKDSYRLATIALSMQELSQHSSLFVPLSTGDKGWRKPGSPRMFDYVNYNPELYYHSSSLLAAALDTLSLKYRHKNNIHTLSDICADMTGYGRLMAVASLGVPFPIHESQYLIEHLNNVTKPIYTAITPSCKIGTDKMFQVITVRGVPETYTKAPTQDKRAREQMIMPAYRCNNVKEMFELYLQATNLLTATNITVMEKPLDIKTPFPKIFSDDLNTYGFVKKDARVESVESVAVIAGYHNGNFIGDMLEKLHREVNRIKFSKLHKFSVEGFETTEWKESMDRLAAFKDNYEDDLEL